jgi:hypothetical protein
MGRGQATQREGLMLLPAWLTHCGTVSAGTEQVLTKKTGQEERTVREWQSGERGTAPFIPFKSGRYLPRHTLQKWRQDG